MKAIGRLLRTPPRLRVHGGLDTSVAFALQVFGARNFAGFAWNFLSQPEQQK
jgi:hypothetical protein